MPALKRYWGCCMCVLVKCWCLGSLHINLNDDNDDDGGGDGDDDENNNNRL